MTVDSALIRAAIGIELVALAAGALVSVALGGASVDGAVRGAIAGALVAAPLFLVDVLLYGRRAAYFRRLPFLAVVVARSLLQLALIVIALVIAATVTGSQATSFLTPVTIGIAVALTLVLNLVWQLSRYLGQNALLDLATGRYRHPRLENRVFLFLDLAGSTAAADRLGPQRFMTLLNEIAYDVAPAVTRGKGTIHRYVGDEIIVTWAAAEGLRDARCLRTCFAMIDAVAARARQYESTFGLVPSFHAALHFGPVVVGEIGDTHREIALLGDTMNVAARIEAESGPMGHPVLASDVLLEHTTGLPSDLVAIPLGPVTLRGRREPMLLSALQRSG